MMRLKKFSLFLIGFFWISASLAAGEVNFNEEKPGQVTPAGYTKYIEIDLGESKLLILSGQVATDEKGQVVGKGDLEKQLDFVFASMKNTLEKAGGSMDNLVKINNYFVDLSNVKMFRSVRDRYVNTKKPPASTTMQVSRFVNPDVLVEIEALAVVPKKK
jgi:enamine deaminase RidA (YjgF/YER057c/UK114 family)